MSEQAPPGWYPVDGGQERYWDGAAWSEQLREAQPGKVKGSRIRDAAAASVARIGSTTQFFPEGTLWSAVGRPVTGIGAGRFHMDANYLYFEKGALRTDSQQVPIAAVLDVDVKQSMTQKARGVFTVYVRIQRSNGIELVAMEDIPDGREAQRMINEAAHAARYLIQQRQNTMRYEGNYSVAPGLAPNVSGTAAPVPSEQATPAVDPIAQIKELASLRDAGILTEDEFASKKAEILSRM